MEKGITFPRRVCAKPPMPIKKEKLVLRLSELEEEPVDWLWPAGSLLLEAVSNPGTKVLLLSRSFRQSKELFRQVVEFHQRLGSKFLAAKTAQELRLDNYSRIVCLPCKEETVRGYANVGLLVIDEAARVPDDLYRAVRPMLAVSDGRIVCLSTP